MSRRLTIDRQERFLQRQRGAGPRDLNLAFDLELPGVPRIQRSPLKPRKSGRSRRTPQSEFLSRLSLKSSKSSRTPKSARVAIRASSGRTPKAAGARNSQSLVETHVNARIKDGASVTIAAECNSQGISNKKPASVGDIVKGEDATHARPSPRRKRKRKSIGQQSTRKKARSVHGSRLKELPKQQQKSGTPTPRSEKLLRAETKSLKHITERPDEPPDISKPSNLEQEPLLLQVPSKAAPKRKKRKSIGQDQRSRKKQELQDVQSAKSPAKTLESSQQQAIEPEQPKDIPLELEPGPKTLKRKRKVIAGSPIKRKKTSTRMVKTQSEDVEQVNPFQASDTDALPATTIPSVKKRGRKAAAAVTSLDTTSKEVIKPIKAQIEVMPEGADDQVHRENTSAPTKDAAVSKPRRRKRVSIGRIPRSRRAVKVDKSIQSPVPLDSELPIALRTKANEEVPTLHRSQVKGRPKQIVKALVTDSPAISNMVQGTVQETALPKRRGRPKKPITAPTVDTLVTANDQEQEPVQAPTPPRNKGGRPKKVIVAAEVVSQATDGHAQELAREIILPKLESLPENVQPVLPAAAPAVDDAATVAFQETSIPKKRGRPRKVNLSTQSEKLQTIPDPQPKAKRERTARTCKTHEQPSEKDHLVSTENHDIGAEADAQAIKICHPEFVPQVKKRGRPKKQDVAPFTIIPAPQNLSKKRKVVPEPSTNTPKKGRSPQFIRASSKPIPTHLSRRIHIKPSNNDEDDSDDPLSDIASLNHNPTSVPVVNVLNLTGQENTSNVRDNAAVAANEARKEEERPTLKKRKRAAEPQGEELGSDDRAPVRVQPP